MSTKFDKFLHPNLTNDNILKSMLAFGAPMLVSYIFLQFYNTVDIVVVGHFLGEKSLAAIAACSAVNDLLIGFGNGFGNGLGIVAARAYGANKEDRLKKIVLASFFITLAVTVFIMIIGHFCLRPILNLLGTPHEIIDEALSYIWVIAIFCGLLFGYNLLSGLLRAIGNSIMPLVFLISSSVLNIFLDILLIAVFHMGVQGTAIATIIAQGISAVLCFIYILKKCKILIPNKKKFSSRPYHLQRPAWTRPFYGSYEFSCKFWNCNFTKGHQYFWNLYYGRSYFRQKDFYFYKYSSFHLGNDFFYLCFTKLRRSQN